MRGACLQNCKELHFADIADYQRSGSEGDVLGHAAIAQMVSADKLKSIFVVAERYMTVQQLLSEGMYCPADQSQPCQITLFEVCEDSQEDLWSCDIEEAR